MPSSLAGNGRNTLLRREKPARVAEAQGFDRVFGCHCNRPKHIRVSKCLAKNARFAEQLPRRDGRVVDGGGLENHCTRKGTGGSNPSLSVFPVLLRNGMHHELIYASGCAV